MVLQDVAYNLCLVGIAKAKDDCFAGGPGQVKNVHQIATAKQKWMILNTNKSKINS
jgi:hypothetical protein